MSQKNEMPLLILSLLITVALLGGGFWFFREQILGDISSRNSQVDSPTPKEQAQQRISLGNTILVKADATSQKLAGVEAFAKGDYATAISQFQSSLQKQRNDPETLIYLNNAKAAGKNPIKIAVVVPVGGNLNIAKEILRGVAQAQNEIDRAGGIKGRLLQVAIANDDNNPDISKEIATQLVNDSSILAVVGHNTSNATLAAIPEYQRGLVAISPTSDAKTLTNSSQYFFRTIPSIRFQADALSRYALRTAKLDRIGICIDSQAAASVSIQEEFTSAVFADGGKVVEINCDLAAENFNSSAIVSEAISNGADGLLLAPSVDRLNLATEIAKADKQRLFLLGSSTMYTFQTLDKGKAEVNGMVLAVPWHPNSFPDNPFPQQAMQLWGGEVNWRSALAYDATLAIIAGFKQGEISRQGLQQTLSNPNFSTQGATGEISFLPSGDRNSGSILVQIQPGQKSGTGFDFVPVPLQ
ncbi:MAG: ABC transporter substrate-binding protein [Hydrococcus sp. Prado102]|jgi:branched-chain amino acid transport system substrate-binding protein|nr:ABC transporter substrate-binding protein [Hydrococcus sp. Prado102]